MESLCEFFRAKDKSAADPQLKNSFTKHVHTASKARESIAFWNREETQHTRRRNDRICYARGKKTVTVVVSSEPQSSWMVPWWVSAISRAE